jgi:hypothetical protein
MTWRRLARAGAAAALAASLAAGTITATQAPAPAAPDLAQIAGAVRSAADDAPIARARVVAVAADAEPHVALSGADGKYVLADLPAGSYTLTVTRTGYAPHTYGQGRTLAGTPVVLAPAQRLANVDVALVPGGHISGRILDEDGTPFAGARVDALVSRFEGGMDALVSVASTQTDDRGQFRLHGLAPGQYYVSAADPAFRSVATPKGVQRYSPTYHPGVVSADQARRIAVRETGDAPALEFRLRLVPPARVSGEIVSYDARPLSSGAIIMRLLDGEGVPMVAAEDPSILPDGRFSFSHVVPGRYEIRASGQTASAGGALFSVFSIDVQGNDIAGIRMTLRPGAILDGTLRIDRRKGARPPPLPSLRVRAPFTDGDSFGDPMTGTVQPDGEFALRGVMKGAHYLVVDGLQPPWVVSEVLYRGTNITDRPLAVEEKEQLRGIRVTISDVSGEVSGVVHNRRNLPVANAAVLVFSRVPLFWTRANRRMRAAYTDSLGRFTVAGLPAGDYVAIASMSIDESDLGRRDRLRALEPLGTPVRIESEGAQATVTLQIAPGATAIAAAVR